MTIGEDATNAAPPRTVAIADPVDEQTRSAGAAGESCPSCDSPGAWTISKRHRFNPFSGVIALVLAFWALLIGLLVGFTLLPAAAFATIGLLVVAARRTALVCQVCGLVRPRG